MACTNHLPFMFLALFLILGLLAPRAYSSRLLDEQSMLQKHEQWMAHHGRSYKNEEEKSTRFKIFKENVERIDAHNAGMDKGYKLGLNKFADLSNEEFRASYTGYNKQVTTKVTSADSKSPTSFRYAGVTAMPSAMDWRNKGAVTGVKDQGQCGACWAFSSVAAVEGAYQVKTGKLVSLSEQELVDCDVAGENQGCEGGLMEYAFQFIKKNGLTTEANYPYEQEDGTCNSNKASAPAVTITGYEEVPSNSEQALMQAVTKQPVSVAIEGSGYGFQLYGSGVFTGSCGTDLDHAVTAVGYGTATDGTKYWLVKNSWGTGWGENGYMRIKKDVAAPQGLCGIAMDASYPIA